MSSNLYAQKVSSEHPLILFPLDDDANYISYLEEDERNFKYWASTPTFTVDNEALEDFVQAAPFPESVISRITNTKKQSSFNTTLSSVFNWNSINYDLWTFSVGVYVYLDFTPSNTSITMSYTYGGETRDKTFIVSEAKSWVFLAADFPYPSFVDNINQSVNISFNVNGIPKNAVNTIYFNGLTVGQWSEEYNYSSLGVQGQIGSAYGTLIPQSLQNTYMIKSLPYGYDSEQAVTVDNKDEEFGYYLIENNKLLARNTSMPMVYGSSSVTTITPSSTKGPSLVLPGKGFLNTSGKKKTYTVEMWLRVNPDTVYERRIFGPIASDDGIYVEGPFIKIKVGKYTGSHYIGEWYRPMLVQFKYREDATILSINGQEVIFLHFEQDPISNEYEITLPSKTDENGYTNDILAFYAYPDVPQIDIDCVGIYPYDVSNVLAKRRWVYGQAVEFPETINSSYGGSSALIDYQFANYLNNYNYPNIGKWEQAINENTSIIGNALSSPIYSPPIFFFDTKTETDWYTAMSELGLNTITLKPTDTWSTVNGYMYFDNFNKLKSLIYGIYGIFEIPENFSGTQTIFKIEDDVNDNYFKVEIFKNASSIKTRYLFYFNGNLSTLYTSSNNLATGTEVNIGFNIPKIIGEFGNGLRSFFGNTSRLRLFACGDRTFTNTFSGKVSTISICSANSFNSVASLFNDNGFIDTVDVVYDGGTPSTNTWDFMADGGKPETVHVFSTNEYYLPTSIYDGGSPTTGETGYPTWDSIVDGGTPTEVVYDGGTANQSVWDDTFDSGAYNESSWTQTIDPNAIVAGTIDVLDAGGVKSNSESTYTIVLSDNIATYTLNPKIEFGEYKLKVGAKSYWEDYVPLPLLAKKTDTGYNLDFIQLNVDYPKPLFTQNKYLNTNRSLMKMFVSFQDVRNQDQRISFNNFLYTEFANSNNVVIPTGTTWASTKYEITDNTIIYPPDLSNQSNITFDDLAIAIHIEFVSNDVEKQQIKIKTLQLASKLSNENKESEVGTKLGKSLYMYELESGTVPGISLKKPSLISKKSTPYIYLTRNSGIQTTSVLETNEDAGFYMPINESLNSGYYLNSLMLSMRFDNISFSSGPVEIFELDYKSDKKILFYAEPTTPFGNRIKIYAKLDNVVYTNIYFFVNGKKTPTPTININEWNMLSFAFTNALDMTSYSGKFKVKYPMVVHQISAYQKVNNVNGNAIDLGLSSYYGISASELHGSYTGRNVIRIRDNSKVLLYDFNRAYYQNVSVTTKTIDPA